MPRYYFEVENENSVFEDAEGEEYPSDEKALNVARRLALEMTEDNAELAGGTLRVLNTEGEVLGEFIIPPTKEQLQ
jgi:hypothetical protein